MANTSRVLPPFPVNYDEGLIVGYKWYGAEKKQVLFPFGLSCTKFAYSGLQGESAADSVTIHATLTNFGSREDSEVAEIYAAPPASVGEWPKRLIGWKNVLLAAGATESIAVSVPNESLSIYDTATKALQLVPGRYAILVGGSSQDLPLRQTVQLGQ